MWSHVLAIAVLIPSILAISFDTKTEAVRNFVTKSFNNRFYSEFRNAGPLADIYYSVQPANSDIPASDFDWRQKVWVGAQIIKEAINGQQTLRFTVVRLDNVGDSAAKNFNHRSKPFDTLWRQSQGWPVELKITLESHKGRSFQVPANPDSDVLQFDVLTSDFAKVQEKGRQIPHNIFQVRPANAGSSGKALYSKLSAITKLMNPGWSHTMTDAAELAQALKEFEAEYPNMAMIVQTQSEEFKTQLYGLLMLYHHGGVFTDAQVVPLVAFDQFLPSTGGMLLKKDQGFYGGFMALPKHSSFAQAAIQQMLWDKMVGLRPVPAMHTSGFTQWRVFAHRLAQKTEDILDTNASFDQNSRFVFDEKTGNAILAVYNSEAARQAAQSKQQAAALRLQMFARR